MFWKKPFVYLVVGLLAAASSQISMAAAFRLIAPEKLSVGQVVPMQFEPPLPANATIEMDAKVESLGIRWFFADRVLIPWKPGALDFPALNVKDANGVSLGQTEPVHFQIETVIAGENAKPFGLEGALVSPTPFWKQALYGMLWVLIIGLLIYFIYRRYFKKPPQPDVLPVLSHSELVLQAWENLKRQYEGLATPLTLEEAKAFHYRATDWVKFVYQRAHLTSEEFLSQFKGLQDERVQIERVFSESDPIKYQDLMQGQASAQNVFQAMQMLLQKKGMLG